MRSAREVAAAERVDPENRLLWKRTVQRLDAEEIRDAMLATSGELAQSLGGPSALTSQLRRTIDTRVIRNARDALLDAFDAPDGNITTPRRNATTTANQALLLINGNWTLARAQALAERLRREPGSADLHEGIILGYRLAFGRAPEPQELAESSAFLARQAALKEPAGSRGDQAAELAALADFCHVLLNSNEFMYVD
jgi:hypothetical protein